MVFDTTVHKAKIEKPVAANSTKLKVERIAKVLKLAAEVRLNVNPEKRRAYDVHQAQVYKARAAAQRKKCKKCDSPMDFHGDPGGLGGRRKKVGIIKCTNPECGHSGQFRGMG